jgi:hypothetical protein
VGLTAGNVHQLLIAFPPENLTNLEAKKNFRQEYKTNFIFALILFFIFIDRA